MKKIAIFLGDFFWSSIPYDGLSLIEALNAKNVDVDLIMFEKDIRLNKKFTGYEKFFFDVKKFSHHKSLITIKTWEDFYKISSNYSLIISSVHIAPKTRYPENIKNKVKCPMAVWDIGGADIMTNAKFATYYFVKGPVWKEWLNSIGVDKECIHVTGSPHYDCYNSDSNKDDFMKKYELDVKGKNILICPSNPGSHLEMFRENMNFLNDLMNERSKSKFVFNVVVKTYPNDYLANEIDEKYSGVYKRSSSYQYEIITKKFHDIKVIESHDHFDAMKHCDIMFNMSSSHVSWETHFVKMKSVVTNHIGKMYFAKKHSFGNMPDCMYNIPVASCEELLMIQEKTKQMEDNEYLISTNSIENISNHAAQFVVK